VIDPAEPVSLEMVPVGPGGRVRAPVLILPGDVHLYLDAHSTDADAADWWYTLGTAAMSASLCYVDGDECYPDGCECRPASDCAYPPIGDAEVAR
jgi:hypothetical protein